MKKKIVRLLTALFLIALFAASASCEEIIPGITKDTLALAQSKFSTVDSISDANNLLSGAGLENAVLAANESKGHFNPFFAANWTHSKMKPLGEVSMDSSNFVFGLSKRTSDRFVYGILFQAGRGRYESTDDYIVSKGDAAYMGGGLFLRYDSPKRWYTQLAFAAGRAWGDFASDDMITAEGGRYAYDYNKGGYRIFNFAFGKITEVKGGELNTYFKLLDELGVSAALVVDDYDIHVAAQDLTRLRAGFRYQTRKENALNGYFGLAYEYCFNFNTGVSLASALWADPEDVTAPDISGGSGMAEFGITYKKQGSPWKFDLGLQGFAGKQDSLSATLTAVREF
ncbi:MAG: autotransporter outer membrane beta-barrel domain-containing protein [Synergistaceae bacterium]|nr:autotransporter outer membrane beta-barrel domain-containing protein [Candidatus Equadaptatus faecalis]